MSPWVKRKDTGKSKTNSWDFHLAHFSKSACLFSATSTGVDAGIPYPVYSRTPVCTGRWKEDRQRRGGANKHCGLWAAASWMRQGERGLASGGSGYTFSASTQTRSAGPVRGWGADAAGITCVFCVGICSRSARALASKVSSKAISAPWTPLSTRLLAYSLRPIDRIQRITRSLLQTSTSADKWKQCS